MKVTVIVAAYRLNGLINTIADLKRQTYKDFDVIIVNDNQQEIRDKIWELIQDKPNYHYVDNFTRCHYFGGISRNIGIAMAFSYIPERDRKKDKDWWIAFHDDDNFWKSEYLETMVFGHTLNPDATLIGQDMMVKPLNKPGLLVKCRLQKQYCDIGSFLYSKKLFDKYGLFPVGPFLKIGYDWEFLKRIKEGGEEISILNGFTPQFIFNKRK